MPQQRTVFTSLEDLKAAVAMCSDPCLEASAWDVGQLTSFSEAFKDAHGSTGHLSGWDVSNATDMSNMFDGASAFNRAIGNWDVSKVENMAGLFSNAAAFNQPIGNWDVSKVKDMGWMFVGASDFNWPIGNWDVSAVTDAEGMFKGAAAFNQPIGNWVLSSDANVEDMFAEATAWNAKYYRDDGTYHGPPSAWVAYPPPPAPLSETERKQAELEEKKREVEEKRAEARALREDAAEKKAAADAQYGDFVGDVEGLDGVDEDVKRKILMLADALMKNQKVVEMAGDTLPGRDQQEQGGGVDRGTSGIPDSAAVWTATAVGVRRRGLLQSVSYDVTALLDPDEVDESAAADAVEALNSGGISATKADVDEEEALKDAAGDAGMDSSVISEFSVAATTYAEAEAAAATAEADPQPEPEAAVDEVRRAKPCFRRRRHPPPPPSPPPRALIWDDEDAASERGRAPVHFAVAAVVALAVVARGG